MFSAASLRPMLASLPPSDPPLVASDLVYEPKYDGIRAIALVEPGAPRPRVRFWSRLGNEKTSQFPELTESLAAWAQNIDVPLVVDGEIVALDEQRRPAGFQRLQGRIHVTVPGYRSSRPITSPQEQPTAFIAFDLLRDGNEDLRALPLVERRARLVRLFEQHGPPSDALRLSEQVVGDGRALLARARKEGWEGLVVKAARSPYRDGKRTPEWRKMKITNEDEFVVGGWTEPKGARAYFGSLILGAYDEAGRLVHAGDCGTGFSGAELERLWKLLKPLETSECPFYVKPKTLGRPRWAKPKLVVQVRYTEWTDDGRLRHPTYLGLRDDKRPEEVKTTRRGSTVPAFRGSKVQGSKVEGSEVPKFQGSKISKSGGSGSNRGRSSVPSEPSNPGTSEPGNLRTSKPRTGKPRNIRTSERRNRGSSEPRRSSRDPLTPWIPAADAMTAQLDALETSKRDGKLQLPDDDTLDVTNPQKIFWPAPQYTKGDLLRYYARMAPVILPVIEDRPLVMKRFPNGIQGEAFYQHRGPEKYPRGVRVEVVEGADVPTMFVGGDLKTLLYMAQLASISMDPWFSKMDSLEEPDLVAIDLDPQPGATFDQILDVARWVKEELDRLKVPGFPKTSGSEGLHIFIPLAPGTSYEAGVLLCQIVATIVATKHPKVATIERMVRRRKERTVYVDYLQNIPGKTLACAYSARASAFAGVSAPLRWEEIDDNIRPQDFTIKTMEARVRSVGDLWAALRKSKPADLARALEKLAK
jgi:bifunctional non-homologous end joining protein LigD